MGNPPARPRPTLTAIERVFDLWQGHRIGLRVHVT